MFGTRPTKLSVALDLLKIYALPIGNMALRSITEFGYRNDEVIVICAVYKEPWKEFVDGLNPDAEAKAAQLINRGLSPTSICATTIDGLNDYLREFQTDICIPQVKPDEGEVLLLVIHEFGHNWLPINIPPSPTQLC